LISSSLYFAAAALEPVTIGYSSFSGAYLPLWIAVEERLGRKYGLDLKAIYAGRIRPQQLLASNEVPFVMATGTGALTSHILGIKDQVVILVTVNKVNSAIFSRPEIKTADELRGKTVATGRPRIWRYYGSVCFTSEARSGAGPRRKDAAHRRSPVGFSGARAWYGAGGFVDHSFYVDREEDGLSGVDRLRQSGRCLSVQYHHGAPSNAGQKSRPHGAG